MDKYQASPEMFLHRLSNLLPKHFGIDNFFFLRFNDYLDQEVDNFHITKELHLSQLHNPHRNDLNEHYCRRWIAIGILEELKQHDLDDAGTYLVKAQRSRFLTNKQEYLCLSIAKPGFPTPSTNVSVTLGIKIDAASRRRIKFLEHDTVPLRDVNETCERCPLVDCDDRVAEPTIVQRRNEQESIKRKLTSLSEGLEKLSAKDWIIAKFPFLGIIFACIVSSEDDLISFDQLKSKKMSKLDIENQWGIWGYNRIKISSFVKKLRD